MNCRLRDIRNPRTALFDIFGFYWCWRKAVRDFQKFCGPGAVRNFDFFRSWCGAVLKFGNFPGSGAVLSKDLNIFLVRFGPRADRLWCVDPYVIYGISYTLCGNFERVQSRKSGRNNFRIIYFSIY